MIHYNKMAMAHQLTCLKWKHFWKKQCNRGGSHHLFPDNEILKEEKHVNKSRMLNNCSCCSIQLLATHNSWLSRRSRYPNWSTSYERTATISFLPLLEYWTSSSSQERVKSSAQMIADLNDSCFIHVSTTMGGRERESLHHLVVILGLAVLCLQLLDNHNPGGDKCLDIWYCIVLCHIRS